MFHLELRQFPHVARAFNLTADQLDSRILAAWARGQSVQWEGRQFTPEKARITIYEGPQLRADELGMGRGWPNATRAGRDVTEALLAQATQRARRDPALDALKHALLDRVGNIALPISEALSLAGDQQADALLSARVALAERAIWELLHERRLALVDARDTAVDPARWRELLLDFGTWTDSRVRMRRLRDDLGD